MKREQLDRQWPLRRAAPVLLVASALLLSLAIVNPFREMLAQDDAWIYARMVQHLLATGKYQLDAATAANMPVQIYLAAGLARIFGYSLVLLRFTTLGLFTVGLICWYSLLRELGNSRAVATLFTLAVLANPIVLVLSFAFMSDVQFIAWVLLAQMLYVRGIRRNSAWLLFLGSLAAGCAIGTRQFGIALIVGLLAAWLVAKGPARPQLRLIVIALAVPCVAAAAQVYFGMKTPNLVQSWRLQQTHVYLSSPPLVIARELFWRLSLITQYLAISLLPLLPLSFFIARRIWKERLGRVPLWVFSIAGCVAVVLAVWMSSSLTARPSAGHHPGLWEPLELDWLLPLQFENFHPLMRLIDLIGLVGSAPLICILLYAVKRVRSPRQLRPETIFLLASGLGLLALHLPYGQLNDTYVAPMSLYVLLLLAALLSKSPPTQLQLRLSALSCMAVILALSFWMRGQYEYQEAFWKAAETLQREGVAPADIAVSLHWQLYHGLFDTWVAAGHLDSQEDWYQRQRRQAHYLVRLTPRVESTEGWQLLGSYEYRNVFFAKRYVTALKLLAQQQPESSPGNPSP